MLPQPKPLTKDTPFGKAEETDLQTPSERIGGTEGYIDDGNTAVLASQRKWNMIQRAQQAVVMAFFLVFCLLAGIFEPIPRPDPTSIQKLLVEGGLTELIIFLGRQTDTRHLAFHNITPNQEMEGLVSPDQNREKQGKAVLQGAITAILL